MLYSLPQQKMSVVRVTQKLQQLVILLHHLSAAESHPRSECCCVALSAGITGYSKYKYAASVISYRRI